MWERFGVGWEEEREERVDVREDEGGRFGRGLV